MNSSNSKQWIKSAPERKGCPPDLYFPLLAVFFRLYGSVLETQSSKTVARHFYLTNGICFQSGSDTTCKGYAIFQTTLCAQQTAAEQTPHLPPEPTNAKIYLRIVLYYLSKAQSEGRIWTTVKLTATPTPSRCGLRLQQSAQVPTDPLTAIWHQHNLSGKLSWLNCQVLFQWPVGQYDLLSFLEPLNQHSFIA